MVDEILSVPLRPIEPPGPRGTPSARGPGEVSFKDVLSETLKEIDGLQHRAMESVRSSFDPADPAALHEVMIAVEEANIAFQFAMEVRNRLVDAYNELMRMQV